MLKHDKFFFRLEEKFQKYFFSLVKLKLTRRLKKPSQIKLFVKIITILLKLSKIWMQLIKTTFFMLK